MLVWAMENTTLKKIIHISVFVAFLALALFGGLSACTTEKDAPLNRGYHNMTAKYNGYFNANEIIEVDLESYRTQYNDDYTKILPVEIYPEGEDKTAMFPDMNEAIEKCTKVIYKHAMPNPNKVKSKDEEWCSWIDDNWLVIGKAHYVKGEYSEAEKTFKYIKKAYNNEKSIYAAKIWLAKTYIEENEYSKAKMELDKVTLDIQTADANKKTFKSLFKKTDDTKKKRPKSKYARRKRRKEKKEQKENEPAKFSKKLKVDYQITFADLYIKQNEYGKAIPHLEEAIKLERNRKKRARYMFILAQLYQKQGDGNQAVFYYNKVAKSNANYEMRFYAKIFSALASTSGSDALRKDLHKMLKDDKNEEYKDQIYYVLAELDLKENKVADAKANLSRSVYYSINNDLQKGKSYQKLADLHFAERDYIKAQKYYDSCVNVIPETYEQYAYINKKASSLSDLVFNYDNYTRQDSLQRIAKMPEKDREKFLKNTVKQIEEENARKKAEEQQRLIEKQNRVNNTANNSGSGSKWYFYNQKAMSAGFNDFRSNWGQRVLEDDWRRSNKQSNDVDFEETEENLTAESKDSMNVDLLRKDLPLTNAALDSSNTLLMSSLYNLGIIYKEQLGEIQEAEKYFELLINRGIDHPKVLSSLYQLYLINQKSGNSKAMVYKTRILEEYPDSDIAKMVEDPEYMKKKEMAERADLEAYSKVLNDYRYQRYMTVISECSQMINSDSTNKFIGKYYLLKAFAISKSGFGGPDQVRKTLEDLYALDPQSDEGRAAKQYLDQLNQGQSITQNQPQVSAVPYVVNETSVHYFVLVFPNSKGAVNNTKVSIANFNTEYFGSLQLKMTNMILDKDHQLIQLKSFPDAEKAMVYYNAFISENAQSFLGNISKEFDFFVINKENYSLFYKNKDISGYSSFFESNY